MDLPFTFTLREIVQGMITLTMWEFIFRPLVFKGGVKGADKKDQGKQTEETGKTLYNPRH